VDELLAMDLLVALLPLSHLGSVGPDRAQGQGAAAHRPEGAGA